MFEPALRDAWGMPLCFHELSCPSGGCSWRPEKPQGFITRAIEELEDHLRADHRALVHLHPTADLGSDCLAHALPCEVEGAILDGGILTDGQVHLAVRHVRFAKR